MPEKDDSNRTSSASRSIFPVGSQYQDSEIDPQIKESRLRRSDGHFDMRSLSFFIGLTPSLPLKIAEEMDLKLIPKSSNLVQVGTGDIDIWQARIDLGRADLTREAACEELNQEVCRWLACHLDRDTIDPPLARTILYYLGYQPDLTIEEMVELTKAEHGPFLHEDGLLGFKWDRGRMSPRYLKDVEQVDEEFIDEYDGQVRAYLIMLRGQLGEMYDRGDTDLPHVRKVLEQAGFYSNLLRSDEAAELIQTGVIGDLTTIQMMENLGLWGNSHHLLDSANDNFASPTVVNYIPAERSQDYEGAKNFILLESLKNGRLGFWLSSGESSSPTQILQSLKQQMRSFTQCTTIEEAKRNFPGLYNYIYEILWGEALSDINDDWIVKEFVIQANDFWDKLTGLDQRIVIFSEEKSINHHFLREAISVVDAPSALMDTRITYAYRLSSPRQHNAKPTYADFLEIKEAYRLYFREARAYENEVWEDLLALADQVYSFSDGETCYGIVRREKEEQEGTIVERVEIEAKLQSRAPGVPAKVRYVFVNSGFSHLEFFKYRYHAHPGLITEESSYQIGDYQDYIENWQYVDPNYSFAKFVRNIASIPETDKAEMELIEQIKQNKKRTRELVRSLDKRSQKFGKSIGTIYDLAVKYIQKRIKERHTYRGDGYGSGWYGNEFLHSDWLRAHDRYASDPYFNVRVIKNGAAVHLTPKYKAGDDMIAYPVSSALIAFYPDINAWIESPAIENDTMVEVVLRIDQSVFDVTSNSDVNKYYWVHHLQFDRVLPVFQFDPVDFVDFLASLCRDIMNGEARERCASLNSAAWYVVRPELVGVLETARQTAQGGFSWIIGETVPLNRDEIQHRTRETLVEKALGDTTQYYAYCLERVKQANHSAFPQYIREGSPWIDITIRIDKRNGLQFFLGNISGLDPYKVGRYS